MIEFIEITKTFRNDFWDRPFTVLNKLSFKIEEGSLVGFLGANGTGKTTSLKILMQFISQNSGKVVYGKKLGSSFREILSNIGFMPERPYFYPHLTGRDFLIYMGKLNDVKKDHLKITIKKWSERMQVDYALDRKIRGYSKGMLQRLGFISILLHDPKLLILDEPLSGLDPIGRKEIKDALEEVHRDGKSVFFSSHIVSDVEAICDRVIVMEQGSLIYQGDINSLIKQHQNLDFEINYSCDNQEFKKVISPNEQNSFVKTLVEKGCLISEIVQKKPTLEEIVYKIKQ